ncbi:MAG: hypothetical protein WC227_03575 [Patescibacteria group bacterium]|jgi:hypothetical protein
MNPNKLLELIQTTGRVMAGHPDHLGDLKSFAEQLFKEHTEAENQPILLAGWERKADGFEGDDISGDRETLGLGLLRAKMDVCFDTENHVYATFPNQTSDTVSTVIEVWEWVSDGGKKAVFLVFEINEYNGVVGLDNRPGSDTTWRVAAIRVINLI